MVTALAIPSENKQSNADCCNRDAQASNRPATFGRLHRAMTSAMSGA